MSVEVVVSNNAYDTAIKDIGGVKDYSIIFDLISTHFDKPELVASRVKEDNNFDIRSLKTRTKVEWALNKSILQFINDDHFDLVGKLFQKTVPINDQKFYFFWHFCLMNRLFREISTKVFAKAYFSGRAQISKDDILAYINDIKTKENDIGLDWSEETKYRVATKYLNLMSKFGFVSDGRVKSFNYISPSSEALVIFLYFSQIFNMKSKNILVNDLLPASFVHIESLQDKLKKLSVKGFFNMSFNGVDLNIELIHSYKGIYDVIYSRS